VAAYNEQASARSYVQRWRRWMPLLLLLLLWPEAAFAQRGGRVAVVADGGALFPFIGLTHGRRFTAKTTGTGGVLINYGITDHLGVQFGLSYAEEQVRTNEITYNTLTMENLTADARWNILTGLLQPYLLLGVDYAVFSLDPPLSDENDPGLNGGVGLEAWLTDHVSFGAVGVFERTFPKQFNRAEFVTVAVTLAYTF